MAHRGHGSAGDSHSPGDFVKICSLYSSTAFLLTPLILFAASRAGTAQSSANNSIFVSSSSDGLVSGAPAAVDPAPSPAPAEGATRGVSGVAPTAIYTPRPFSRVSIGGSVGTLGASFESSMNVIPHLNLRLTGDYLGFGVNNFSTQGFNIDANLHMASARASVDYYPFHAGFRLSPGVMFYNQNHAVANFMVEQGTSFSLNNYTYYSATGANAVQGLGRIGLGNGSPAFTMTTGWGNTLPRGSHHFSFPFEIGAAFTSTPTFGLNLTGVVCNAQGQNCVNVATDPTAQANLHAQVAKYQNDMQWLHTYPILSFGVAYSFGNRGITQVR